MKASELLGVMAMQSGADERLALEILVAVLRHVRRSGVEVLEVDLDEDQLLEFLASNKNSYEKL